MHQRRSSLRSLAQRLRAFEQQKARLAEAEAKLKLAEKKARTRQLIETGTIVEKAGLIDLKTEALYGALLSLKDGAKTNKQIDQWTSAGLQALSEEAEAASSEPIIMEFSAELDKQTAADLRSIGFRYNKVLRHWEGMANVREAETFAEAHGGHLKVISHTPDGHDDETES
jgi:hypothetical protein